MITPAIAAVLIARRIKQTLVSRGCGSYLFIDEAKQAFVLSADNATGDAWTREHYPWWVGFYQNGGIDDLAVDITHHIGQTHE